MSIHTITEQELDDWRTDHWVQFAASFGFEPNSAKRLEVSLRNQYRVIDHGVVVYVGGNPAMAVRKYNEAR